MTCLADAVREEVVPTQKKPVAVAATEIPMATLQRLNEGNHRCQAGRPASLAALGYGAPNFKPASRSTYLAAILCITKRKSIR
ncbi:hypothetical protein G3N58_03390 [Paraburkholderia sp. Ac-20342]|uniref:hypothetical protein n=1 Tax=Paraburkholderia sp. Ac-20342 TaxID=2703889 RepID=UPI0019813BF8|nr:hypothetical protein [Paraburkholderia sp. Ac-20342]MBN3845874.1 hypothetical protein [Paraburkholderia sp. Ac-20342]